MPNNCVITGCTHREGKNGVRMYRIPAIRKNSTSNYRIEDLTERRQRLWFAAIQRKGFDTATRLTGSHRVCSDHFVKGKPANLHDEADPDWVPTLKLGHGKEMMRGSFLRMKGRTQRKDALHAASALLDLASATTTTRESEVHVQKAEVGIQTDLTIRELDSFQHAFNGMQRELVELRGSLGKICFDETKFRENDERSLFYTGLEWEMLFALVKFLSPFIHAGRNSLSKFQEILLVLMRLRLGMHQKFLGDLFGVDQSTASRIFLRVLNVVHTKLNFLIYWPEREALNSTVPSEFKKYLGTKVSFVVDCFEVVIDRPNHLKARAQTHKSASTVKYLICITPQGVVSYVSQGWGGATSDKYIIENSGFLPKLETGDFVLASKGFNVHDSIGFACAELTVPPLSQGKKELVPFELDTTNKLTPLRLHVEKLMGCIKDKFTLLESKMPSHYLTITDNGVSTLDQIVTVCACLININTKSCALFMTHH